MLSPDDFDAEDWPEDPPGPDRVIGLVAPDLGTGALVGERSEVDLYYGDVFSQPGPFVWIIIGKPEVIGHLTLTQELGREHERITDQAWLDDPVSDREPQPATVTVTIDGEPVSAEALIDGAVSVVRATVGADLVTVIGRGIDVAGLRLATVEDLDPLRAEGETVFRRLAAAAEHRPEIPVPALEGQGIAAHRALASWIITDEERHAADPVIPRAPAPTPEWTDENPLPRAARWRRQAVREHQRLTGCSRREAEAVVSSIASHVAYLADRGLDQLETQPRLIESDALLDVAVDEILRYQVFGEEVSSQPAQRGWDDFFQHELAGVGTQPDDDWFDRYFELQQARRAGWHDWLEQHGVSIDRSEESAAEAVSSASPREAEVIDSSQLFADLVDEGAFFGHEHQLHLSDLADSIGEHRWEVDFDRQHFALVGTRRIRATVHLIGSTVASADGTGWLWGWANPSDLPATVLQLCESVAEYGRQHGIAELTEPEIPVEYLDQLRPGSIATTLVSRMVEPPEERVLELAGRVVDTAKRVSGHWTSYSGEAGPGVRAFFLIDASELALSAPSVARTMRLFTEVLSFGQLQDHRRALRSYTTLRGITCNERADTVELSLPDGDIIVKLDQHGRIADITAHTR